MASRFAGRFVSAHATNPAKEPVPVWEQQWVLPHPTARIKVLKWVKTDKLRSYPEEEDARFVYAEATNAAAEAQAAATAAAAAAAAEAANPNTSSTVLQSTDAQGGAPSAASSSTAAADVDAVMIEASNSAKTAPAVATALNSEVAGADAELVSSAVGLDADETQGLHLFDETQADIEMSTAGDSTRLDTTEPPTALGTGAEGTPVPPPSSIREGDAADPAATTETAAQAEDEEDQEEEDAEPVQVDKHQTIRIGGPLPEGIDEVPVSASGEAEDGQAAEEGKETDKAVASPSAPPAETGPVPQVETELHPPPDGVPAAPAPPAVTEAVSVTAPDSEARPAVDVGEGDNLGGVEETTRQDPEVQQQLEAKGVASDDVVAVVHDGPGGAETVKVVVD
ncbi:unnamed protein product [Parajaminaea phylloscopi]